MSSPDPSDSAAATPRSPESSRRHAGARPQGSGLATEALGAIVSTLFDEHRLHRVFAKADDRNTAAHRRLDRLALRCQTRHVEADWFKDEWTTLRVYAVPDGEWRAARG